MDSKLHIDSKIGADAMNQGSASVGNLSSNVTNVNPLLKDSKRVIKQMFVMDTSKLKGLGIESTIKNAMSKLGKGKNNKIGKPTCNSVNASATPVSLKVPETIIKSEPNSETVEPAAPTIIKHIYRPGVPLSAASTSKTVQVLPIQPKSMTAKPSSTHQVVHLSRQSTTASTNNVSFQSARVMNPPPVSVVKNATASTYVPATSTNSMKPIIITSTASVPIVKAHRNGPIQSDSNAKIVPPHPVIKVENAAPLAASDGKKIKVLSNVSLIDGKSKLLEIDKLTSKNLKLTNVIKGTDKIPPKAPIHPNSDSVVQVKVESDTVTKLTNVIKRSEERAPHSTVVSAPTFTRAPTFTQSPAPKPMHTEVKLTSTVNLKPIPQHGTTKLIFHTSEQHLRPSNTPAIPKKIEKPKFDSKNLKVPNGYDETSNNTLPAKIVNLSNVIVGKTPKFDFINQSVRSSHPTFKPIKTEFDADQAKHVIVTNASKPAAQIVATIRNSATPHYSSSTPIKTEPEEQNDFNQSNCKASKEFPLYTMVKPTVFKVVKSSTFTRPTSAATEVATKQLVTTDEHVEIYKPSAQKYLIKSTVVTEQTDVDNAATTNKRFHDAVWSTNNPRTYARHNIKRLLSDKIIKKSRLSEENVQNAHIEQTSETLLPTRTDTDDHKMVVHEDASTVACDSKSEEVKSQMKPPTNRSIPRTSVPTPVDESVQSPVKFAVQPRIEPMDVTTDSPKVEKKPKPESLQFNPKTSVPTPVDESVQSPIKLTVVPIQLMQVTADSQKVETEPEPLQSSPKPSADDTVLPAADEPMDVNTDSEKFEAELLETEPLCNQSTSDISVLTPVDDAVQSPVKVNTSVSVSKNNFCGFSIEEVNASFSVMNQIKAILSKNRLKNTIPMLVSTDSTVANEKQTKLVAYDSWVLNHETGVLEEKIDRTVQVVSIQQHIRPSTDMDSANKSTPQIPMDTELECSKSGFSPSKTPVIEDADDEISDIDLFHRSKTKCTGSAMNRRAIFKSMELHRKSLLSATTDDDESELSLRVRPPRPKLRRLRQKQTSEQLRVQQNAHISLLKRFMQTDSNCDNLNDEILMSFIDSVDHRIEVLDNQVKCCFKKGHRNELNVEAVSVEEPSVDTFVDLIDEPVKPSEDIPISAELENSSGRALNAQAQLDSAVVSCEEPLPEPIVPLNVEHADSQHRQGHLTIHEVTIQKDTFVVTEYDNECDTISHVPLNVKIERDSSTKQKVSVPARKQKTAKPTIRKKRKRQSLVEMLAKQLDKETLKSVIIAHAKQKCDQSSSDSENDSDRCDDVVSKIFRTVCTIDLCDDDDETLHEDVIQYLKETEASEMEIEEDTVSVAPSCAAESETNHELPEPIDLLKSSVETITTEKEESKTLEASVHPRNASPTTVIDAPSNSSIENASERRDLPTETEDAPSEKQDLPNENLNAPSEKQHLPIENQDLPSEKQDLPNETQDLPSEKQDAPSEKQDLASENQDLPSKKQDLPTENQDLPSEKVTSISAKERDNDETPIDNLCSVIPSLSTLDTSNIPKSTATTSNVSLMETEPNSTNSFDNDNHIEAMDVDVEANVSPSPDHSLTEDGIHSPEHPLVEEIPILDISKSNDMCGNSEEESGVADNNDLRGVEAVSPSEDESKTEKIVPDTTTENNETDTTVTATMDDISNATKELEQHDEAVSTAIPTTSKSDNYSEEESPKRAIIKVRPFEEISCRPNPKSVNTASVKETSSSGAKLSFEETLSKVDSMIGKERKSKRKPKASKSKNVDPVEVKKSDNSIDSNQKSGRIVVVTPEKPPQAKKQSTKDKIQVTSVSVNDDSADGPIKIKIKIQKDSQELNKSTSTSNVDLVNGDSKASRSRKRKSAVVEDTASVTITTPSPSKPSRKRPIFDYFEAPEILTTKRAIKSKSYKDDDDTRIENIPTKTPPPPPSNPRTSKRRSNMSKTPAQSELPKSDSSVVENVEKAKDEKVTTTKEPHVIQPNIQDPNAQPVPLTTLKSGRGIKPPVLAPLNASEQYVCGNCKEEVMGKDWTKHIRKHYGLAWRVDVDPPIDMENIHTMSSKVLNFTKKANIKIYKCPKCEVEKKSALGYLSHLEVCGLTPEEVKSKLVKCEHCPSMIRSCSMKIHLTFCSGLKRLMEKEKKPTEEAENTEECYNDIGRAVRRSAQKAMSSFKDLGKAPEAKLEDYVERVEKASIKQHRKWKKLLKENSSIECVRSECEFTTDDLVSMVNHFSSCVLVDGETFYCNRCEHGPNTRMLIEEHIKATHSLGVIESIDDKVFSESDDDAELGEESSESDGESGDEEISEKGGGDSDLDNDDEDEDDGWNAKGYKKKRQRDWHHSEVMLNSCLDRKVLSDYANLLKSYAGGSYYYPTLEWTQDFRDMHFSNKGLLPAATPNTFSVLCSTLTDLYLPRVQESKKFLVKNVNKYRKVYGTTEIDVSDSWKSLKRFEATIDRDCLVLFTGGPILSMAWLPVPDDNLSQLLAVCCRREADDDILLNNTTAVKCLIQIWNFHKLKNDQLRQAQTPHLLYSVAYDHGPIIQMEFCPSGGFTEDRLGLLAVSSFDGHVDILALPKNFTCDNSKIENLIFTIQPALRLCCERDRPLGVLMTKLVWSQSKGHTKLAGGFANGLVAIWNLRNLQTPHTCNTIDGITTLLPTDLFFAANKTIRLLEFHHDENNEARWLVAGSHDPKVKFFDTHNVYLEISTTTAHSRIVAGCWPIHWTSFLLGIDNAYSLKVSGIIVTQPLDIGCRTSTFYSCIGSTCDISFNNWLNSYVFVTSYGDIHVGYVRQMISGFGETRKQRSILGYTDSIGLNRSDSEDGNGMMNDEASTSDDPQPSTSSASSRIESTKAEYSYPSADGIVFCDFPNPLPAVTSPCYTKIGTPPMGTYNMVKVNKVVFNPNVSAYKLYALGYESGFVRINQLVPK